MGHNHCVVAVSGVEIVDRHRNAGFEYLSNRCLKIKNNSDVSFHSSRVETTRRAKMKTLEDKQQPQFRNMHNGKRHDSKNGKPSLIFGR